MEEHYFILDSKVSSARARAFVAHLKADYKIKDKLYVSRQAEYIGYQGGSYWLISSKVLNSAKQFINWKQLTELATKSTCIPWQLCTCLRIPHARGLLHCIQDEFLLTFYNCF